MTSFLGSMVLALGVASLVCPAGSIAQESWLGVVSYVVDGDTLYVRPASGGKPRSVRLSGIDAPEICQNGGAASRQALQARVLRREVTVLTQGRDDYGRDLSTVQLDSEDLGHWMVSYGHAWSYRYRGHPGPYVQAQQQARLSGRGLFADAAAENPRAFRKRHGSCAMVP